MANTLRARRLEIGLVVGFVALLLVGFSFAPRPGSSMMAQSYQNNGGKTQCNPPVFTRGQTLAVTVSDMGMMMGDGSIMNLTASPSTIGTGRVNIVMRNSGLRTHEVVVLPLGEGETVGQRTIGSNGKVNESASLGEVSKNCGAGTGEGILPGARGWTTLTLTPGRYELICNLSNHYAAGMYYEVKVN